MATLKDVGREAGVGVSTASVVLSGGRHLDQIPEATQARIRDAAVKLKYRPNAGGRQLRHRRTGTIALFLSAEADRSALSTDLLYAINDELLKHDYALNFVRLDDASLSNPDFTPRFLRQNEVDGVLVNYNAAMPQRFIDLIHHYEIRAIFLNIKRQTDAVYFDHYKATRQVVDRMVAVGHRRIYLVHWTGSFAHYSVEDSLVAYRDATQAHGLEPVVFDKRVPRSERMNAGMELLESRVAGLTAPTAIVTLYASSAIPLIQATERLGLRIPRDLSLVTAGGSNLTSLLTPEPSHVFLPWALAGRTGVRMLMNLIEGRAKENLSGCLECEFHEAGGTIQGPVEGDALNVCKDQGKE